jgi:hypothetical protein
MKNLSRDAKLSVGILILLVLVTTFSATQRQTKQEYPRLSSLSSTQDGALALKLWVKDLQYEVDESVLENFVPPEQARILLVLEPMFPSADELKALDHWVKAGGTLIAIGEQYGMYSLADHFDFDLRYLADQTAETSVETPLLGSPSIPGLKNLRPKVGLRSERDDYVVLATQKGEPVLLSFEQGKGRVILGTLTQAFTNAGLKEAGNAELVLNILSLARTRGTIWFDEWHHGLRNQDQILGPAAFLRRTPVGHALLFSVVVIFLGLLIQGRGFGRPVPLPQEIRRRGAMEHVTGIANLSRRAAHRPAVMMYYHQQIKRRLGQRYRLDPNLDDQAYVEALAGYNPSLDKNELLTLLERLKHKNISETEMVHLAAEAAKWIDT